MIAALDVIAISSPEVLALATAGLLLAGVVKGATGLGYTTCALPFLVHAINLETAMTLVLIPAMATNFAVAISGANATTLARSYARLYVTMLPGIAVGLWLLANIDRRVAVTLLGCSIIGYVGVSLARPNLSLSRSAANALQVPVGLINGLLTGMTGSQVMPLVPYVLAAEHSPDRVVQAINIGVLIASAALLAGMTTAGFARQEIVALSAVAALPAVAGSWLGQRIRRAIAADHLRTAILVVLAFAGLGLIVR